jgi:predicted RNA binding protein YcfA (HicA-like mRNA interferase family)
LPKLPVLSADKVVKALKKAGFKIVRQSGSHIHLWNEDSRSLVTVPNHPKLAKGTLISIFKQSKIDRDDFLKLIK